MGVKGKLKVAKKSCRTCNGPVMLDYKHKWWYGKCIMCSRIWRISRKDYREAVYV